MPAVLSAEEANLASLSGQSPASDAARSATPSNPPLVSPSTSEQSSPSTPVLDATQLGGTTNGVKGGDVQSRTRNAQSRTPVLQEPVVQSFVI